MTTRTPTSAGTSGPAPLAVAGASEESALHKPGEVYDWDNTITLAPRLGYEEDMEEIPDSWFGSNQARVIATSLIQGEDAEIRCASRVIWGSDDHPSRKSYDKASELASVLVGNLENMLSTTIYILAKEHGDINRDFSDGTVQQQWERLAEKRTATINEKYMRKRDKSGLSGGCEYVDNDTFVNRNPPLPSLDLAFPAEQV